MIVYGKFGIVYYFSNDFKSVIDYYNKVLIFVKEMKNKNGECINYGNFGSSYFKIGEYEKVIECFIKVFRFS